MNNHDVSELNIGSIVWVVIEEKKYTNYHPGLQGCYMASFRARKALITSVPTFNGNLCIRYYQEPEYAHSRLVELKSAFLKRIDAIEYAREQNDCESRALLRSITDLNKSLKSMRKEVLQHVNKITKQK